MIKKLGREYAVMTKDGKKLLGRHETEQQAKRHIKAIESYKNRDDRKGK